MIKKILLPLSCFAILLGCRTQKQEFHSGYIDIKDTKIYYETVGKGRPLIFIHGGFMDNSMWDNQKEFFAAKGYKVICYDNYGHGNTMDGKQTLYYHEIIDSLYAHFKLVTADIVGLSLGSMCALDFVVSHPEKVNKLVLSGIYIRGYHYSGDSILVLHSKNLKDNKIINDHSAYIHDFSQMWLSGPYRELYSIDTLIVGKFQKMVINKIEKHGYDKWGKFDEQGVFKKLDTIRSPVLLINGELDYKSIHITSGTFANNVKETIIKNIAETAHTLPIEKPDDFNNSLLEFLK